MTTNIPGYPEAPRPVLAVVGPTGVGKTALAEELAVRLNGEVISADSMQVYRGLDIGTAKPPPADRRVPYHCLDLVDPGEPYSAALYQLAARDAIRSCHERDVLPVVCGGTGLYVRAALDAMEFPPGEQTGNPARTRYEALARDNGPEALHAILDKRDSASAALIHPHNVRRVVRALEMLDDGLSYAVQSQGFSKRESVYATRFLGLTMNREDLYRRIGDRVDDMIHAGLLDEVASLLDRGFREALTAAQAIGYKEIVAVIEGDVGLEEAIEQVKRASTRYAKRQLTWFRADPRIIWIDVTGMSLSSAADRAAEALHLDEMAHET